jgi:hypothetical protein
VPAPTCPESRRAITWIAALALAGAALSGLASCSPAAAAAGSDAGPTTPGASAAPDASPAVTPRAAVLARLARLNQSERFLFGQENATLWGMYLNGALVSTNTWFDSTARAGHFTSDSEAIVGDAPAVLGVSLGMLAFEPTGWNRRAPIAAAIRRQVAQGGLVTMDWHAPSCGADVASAGVLATINVDGRDVPIHAITAGPLFYAEEEYKHAIATRDDVPQALKCLCQIANDAPIGAGPYKGISGKTWLIAHAKQAAQVFRDQGLDGLPIIVRPFHEHTGSWFWWGQPYWNCAALLDKPDAVSGPDAYKAMARTFVSTLRSEPGMGQLIFAYSTDKLTGVGATPSQKERPPSAAERKITDPSGQARDLLRARLVRELSAAGLAYVSPAERGATLDVSQARSRRQADTYVAQRRPFYAEAYAGDDVFDLLGIDLYHPVTRAANDDDLRMLRLQLRVVAEEARARGKPYALTEAGTYRLHLLQVASKAAPGQPLVINGKSSVDEALARLFDPADRAALLRHFGLSEPGPIALTAGERARVVPRASEDWFNRQLLVLAKESKVAYAQVWQTYYDSLTTDRYLYYYIPYPGHPEARSYQRFYADPATCFLRDNCGN